MVAMYFEKDIIDLGLAIPLKIFLQVSMPHHIFYPKNPISVDNPLRSTFRIVQHTIVPVRDGCAITVNWWNGSVFKGDFLLTWYFYAFYL